MTGQRSVDDVLKAMDAAWKQVPRSERSARRHCARTHGRASRRCGETAPRSGLRVKATAGPHVNTIRASLRPRRRGWEVPWILAVPGLVAVFAFHFVPIVVGGFFAFTDWNGVTQPHWVGLDNFREIFADRTARGALWHSLELAGASSRS